MLSAVSQQGSSSLGSLEAMDPSGCGNRFSSLALIVAGQGPAYVMAPFSPIFTPTSKAAISY